MTFFHETADMRKRKNMITRLVFRGEIIEQEDLIVTIFWEHYKNLFGSKASFRVPGYIRAVFFGQKGVLAK